MRLDLSLYLIAEDADLHGDLPDPCDPRTTRCHPTIGAYVVHTDSLDLLRELNERRAINPCPLPDYGLVDFVRRRYREYPRDAVLK